MKFFSGHRKKYMPCFFCGISDRNVNYVLRFGQIEKISKKIKWFK